MVREQLFLMRIHTGHGQYIALPSQRCLPPECRQSHLEDREREGQSGKEGKRRIRHVDRSRNIKAKKVTGVSILAPIPLFRLQTNGMPKRIFTFTRSQITYDNWGTHTTRTNYGKNFECPPAAYRKENQKYIPTDVVVVCLFQSKGIGREECVGFYWLTYVIGKTHSS